MKSRTADGSVRDGQAGGFGALTRRSSGLGEEPVKLIVLIFSMIVDVCNLSVFIVFETFGNV